ncbi:MAG: ABC transporter permease [candidate division WOR-3 bacterium]
MKISDLLYTSFHGLKTHKLRTGLTTLGIIIGIATVITMIAIIEGVNRFVYNVFGSIGSDLIYIQKWKWSFVVGRRGSDFWKEIEKRKDLEIEDAEAIKSLKSIKGVAVTYPVLNVNEVKYKDKVLSVNDIEGVTPEYLYILNATIVKGRNFMDADNDFRRKVCIIGHFVAENLFEKEDEIDKEILIGNQKFTVIGVTEKKGEFLGQNLDNIIIMPLNTALLYFKPPSFGWMKAFQTLRIVAKIKEGYKIDDVQEEIRLLLRQRRNLFFNAEEDFALNTQEMLLSAYRNLTMGIFFAMIGIASLALIVGGIGIMNIMLVSVTERTKEIGIRMAIGAKRRDILFQFLAESIFITLFGGILGLLLGIGFAKIVDILTPLPSYIPLWSIFVAVGFSSITGLFFGIYPATRASKLNPIEALRYE